MLWLITGTPGAGKTSHTLWDWLHDPALKDRPKYATPINGFDYEAHGVTRLDNIEHWQDLPDGSAILVDEADQFLPVKGREVPDFVRALARHRHRGFDFWIITQQGTMINHFARGLIEAHVHYVRAFGENTVSRYRWEKYQSSPDTPQAKKAAQKDRVKVNPKVFELYTSATINTRKREYPWKWYAMLAAVPIAVAIAFLAVRTIMFKGETEPASQAGPVPVTAPASVGLPQLIGTPAQARGFRPEDYVPRLPMDPSTAPAYDHLTMPTDFPRVAACIDSATSCRCYTQQATPSNVDEAVCRVMVKNGWFDRWKSGRQSQAAQIGAPVQPPPVAQGEVGPRTTLVADRPQTWPDT